jgi:hypothetical protein
VPPPSSLQDSTTVSRICRGLLGSAHAGSAGDQHRPDQKCANHLPSTVLKDLLRGIGGMCRNCSAEPALGTAVVRWVPTVGRHAGQ